MARVLLIEPDAVLARVCRTALMNAGHDVVQEGDAQSAVNACDEQTPDIIVMEIQLTNHSGAELLYEIRSYSEWQNIPVVVFTVVPPSEFNDSWSQISADLKLGAYLYKQDTSLAKLKSTVDKQLADSESK